MFEILLDTILDSLKILPFLFVTYLLLEYIEHKSSYKLVSGLKKYGVVGGALLGSFPQCGFSVAGANLYTNRVISAGTLIAVFISTSDEAIPIILANTGSMKTVGTLVLTKVIIAIIAGFIFDRLFSRNIAYSNSHNNGSFTHNCKDGIFISALKHTIQIFVYIAVTILLLNFAIHFVGEENLSKLLLTNSIIQPAAAAIIGFIPNCAASIIITQLYLTGSLSFGSAVAGLCTGAGVGLIVLLRQNKNKKENIKILLYIYIVSTLAGSVIQALM